MSLKVGDYVWIDPGNVDELYMILCKKPWEITEIDTVNDFVYLRQIYTYKKDDEIIGREFNIAVASNLINFAYNENGRLH